MKKIKIGVLGCASIAERLVIPNLIKTNKFDIVAVSSRSREKADEFAKKFNCEAIYGYKNLIERSDIEAIYIPLPTGLHFEWITKSILSGKHIFSEKSITTSYVETEKVIELANKNERCVFENFMFPHHLQTSFVKSKISEGEIGDIKLLRSSFGFPIFDVDTNIRYVKELGGGALLDAGAYTLLGAQVFLGQEQEVISAHLDVHPKFNVDFHGAITLVNNDGIPSQLAFGFDNFYQNVIELWGSSGKITINRAFTAGPTIVPDVVLEKNGESKVYELPKDNHFVNILNLFYDCIFNDFSFQFDQIINQSNLISNVFIRSQER